MRIAGYGAALLGACGLAGVIGAAGGPDCPPGGTALRWESFALPFFDGECSLCHDWTVYSRVYASRGAIQEMVTAGRMPPGNPVPAEERSLLNEWMDCDLPLDGPSCPPGGTLDGWSSFAEPLIAERCLGCHSRDLTGPDRSGAPDGLDFDDRASVAVEALRIRDEVARRRMPPDSWILDEEIDRLLLWLACGAPEEAGGPSFRRGDPNDDGSTNIADPIAILNHLFAGSTLRCLDAADADGSGILDLADPILLLGYLFQGGAPPPPPFEGCGGEIRIGCPSFSACI